MILGLTVEAFTQFHVLLSLIGLAAGFVVLGGLCTNRPLPGWTALYLATTVLTSATGFLFHSTAIGPPHIVGVVSLFVLLLAIVARYHGLLRGAWRGAYVISAVLAFYLNAFVGVVQAFQKIAVLNTLAPTGTEPPFAIAQGLVLLAFVAVGVAAYRNFRPTT